MARKSRKHLQHQPFEQTPSKTEKVYYAGIYARTSSHEQKVDSVETQRIIAEDYIKDYSDIKFRKVYTDYGVSSFDRFRPGFDEMLLDIESGSINCIIVKDFSRFTRDYLEAGEYLQRVFPSLGVRFISVNDGFDSVRDDATQLSIAIWSLVSYHYSIDLSKKIQSVIAYKQEEGTYIPARLPYGYIKVRTEQGVEWVQDELTAPIVREMFKDALSGISAFAIASKMNKLNVKAPSSEFWSNGSVLRVLRNISYTGTLVTRKSRNNIASNPKTVKLQPTEWIRHYGHHAPIINDISFCSVQRILSSRRTFSPQSRQSEDFFCGKLFCGICGRKMRMKRSSNGSYYYICPQRDAAGSSCPNKAKSEAKVKAQVFHALAERIKDMHVCYRETVSYEESLYFMKKTYDQAKMIQSIEQERERQFHVYKRIYEESIIDKTIQSADIQGLLRHLARTRSISQKRISEIVQSRDDYQTNESSGSRMFDLYRMFCEHSELTVQMVNKMAEKIQIDIGGVRVT